MSNYILVANNTCDLPEELIATLDLSVLPLGFTIGETSYKTMPSAEFYQKIREGAMPTTNAANLGEFIDIFEPALKTGKDVLCLAFSSALSVTHSAACMARDELLAQYPERQIIVVDTLSASVGEGILVHGAAKLRLGGASIEEVRDWVENTKLKVAHWIAVNDLTHLKRGGRISAAQALVGGMLGVKPILRINEAGQLVPADKVRGRQASIAKLISQLEASGVDIQNQTLYIAHSDCLEDANTLAAQITEKFGTTDIILGAIGPVIGSHAGIGLLALCFIANDRG